jgi:hypothetical protein
VVEITEKSRNNFPVSEQARVAGAESSTPHRHQVKELGP